LIEQAENGGICANAERDGDDGDSGKQRRLTQAAEGKADVLPNRVHRAQSWCTFRTMATDSFRLSKGPCSVHLRDGGVHAWARLLAENQAAGNDYAIPIVGAGVEG